MPIWNAPLRWPTSAIASSTVSARSTGHTISSYVTPSPYPPSVVSWASIEDGRSRRGEGQPEPARRRGARPRPRARGVHVRDRDAARDAGRAVELLRAVCGRAHHVPPLGIGRVDGAILALRVGRVDGAVPHPARPEYH